MNMKNRAVQKFCLFGFTHGTNAQYRQNGMFTIGIDRQRIVSIQFSVEIGLGFSFETFDVSATAAFLKTNP
jgi:hypothetical protein